MEPSKTAEKKRTRLRDRFRKFNDGGEPRKFRPLDVAALILGLALFITGIITNSTGSSPDFKEKEGIVSLTAVIDGARRGNIDSVAIPTLGSEATVVASKDLTTGMLVEELGADLKAGDAVAVTIPNSIVESTVGTLTKLGVPVWMGQYVAPGTVTKNAGASMASGGKSTNWVAVVLMIAGAGLMALGATRMVMYRSRRKEEQLAAQAPAKPESEVPDVTFADVAGADEAVEQLQEMTEFLKDPDKFTRIGAKIPKGAVLVGPPGTGKTLLARAVAGEAGVPFYAASGSDFVEMYVGVGAKRVRDLFSKAGKHDAAIVFIDEIDAVARKRTEAGDRSGNTEAENTLNALLNEMDGFSKSNVIVLAATNRIDILDPAITRPGRLDRRVEVPLPDVLGREKILGVHAAKVLCEEGIDLNYLARRTPGFSGAQLEAVVNEAALEAVRSGRDSVNVACFDAAVANVAMGKARKSAVVTEHDRRITAWHEAGHTLAALLLADADEPVAVSIVPRGPAGGVTWMAGSDDLFLSRARAHARLVVALSGRTAEQILLGGEFTQGASSDLDNATNTALLMATRFGMTRLGLASREQHLGGTSTQDVSLVVEELLAQAHEESMTLLSEHIDFLEAVADALLAKDDLSYEELATLAREHGVEPAGRATPVPAVPVPTQSLALKNSAQKSEVEVFGKSRSFAERAKSATGRVKNAWRGKAKA